MAKVWNSTGGAAADDAGDHVAGVLGTAELLDDVAHHFPAARRGKRLFAFARRLKQGGAVLDEGGDFGNDAPADGPGVPVLGIDLEIEMDEAVGERARKPERHGLVFTAVAGGDDAPAFGKLVFADSPVENELVERCLHEGRRRIDLIKEENAGLVRLLRQEGRRAPDGGAVLNHGNAAKIRRIEPREARMSTSGMPRRCAICRTIELLPMPGEPQMKTAQGWSRRFSSTLIRREAFMRNQQSFVEDAPAGRDAASVMGDCMRGCEKGRPPRF